MGLPPAIPTPEESARRILDLFVRHYHCRVGGVLLQNHFIEPFATGHWRAADFNAGIEYARQHGWIEDAPNGGFRLTEAGYDAA